MRDPSMVGVIASGAVGALGIFLVLAGLRSRVPRLDEALASLSGMPEEMSAGSTGWGIENDEQDALSRLGAWAFTRLRLPLADRTRRLLGLRGRSIGDFFAEKLILCALGLVAPLLLGAALLGFTGAIAPVPMAVSLLAATLGWFWPDVVLRRGDESVRADAGEALHTFFDLVTLERLANASSSQAMLAAASMSDVPLFTRLRGALERARLEQRPPWNELRRLSRDLELPEIADMADVMRLDEQGAALAETLRARVKELRDAHLMQEKLAAQQVSERMTLWMVVPSLVFGLIFLTPPILKLLGVGG
ncbi:type II secretion system F family protein [Luteococcus sp. Sow4_B9]|uniref:type II secretion system F family protein n=1 Tax=Luteococcus sp. Sow4_B9 TaxID=3438792 RepID=UPI003F969B14